MFSGESNFTDAYVMVEEERDYPPVANAGEDVIIHLPKTEVDLHGNGSSDDHGKCVIDFSTIFYQAYTVLRCI